MDNAKTFNHNSSMIGWGILFLWWGTSILVGPITVGMSVIGTGLILLAVNAARWIIKGVPVNCSDVAVSVVAIVWGAIDTVFNLGFGLSVATMMIVIGTVMIASLLAHAATAGRPETERPPGTA